MGNIRRTILITLFVGISCLSLFSQGYRITVTLPDLPGKEIILSHRIGLKFFTDDTVRLQQDGHAIFSGDTLLPEGMYQIVLPDKKYIEFFLGQIQFFDLRTRTYALNDSLVFTGSEENNHFIRWQNEYTKIRNRSAAIQEKLKKGGLTSDSAQILNRELMSVQARGNRIWEESIQVLQGTLPGQFIKGLKPVKVPENLSSPKSQEEQYRQYLYIRRHFFDQVDFSDARLIRTPLIETKLDQYFNQLVPPFADSIISEANILIDKARSRPDMFQFVVQYLLNLYSDPKYMGTDAVYVWLAERIYLSGQAHWIDSANLQGIRVRVAEMKHLLLGAEAPELDGLVSPDDSPISLKLMSARFFIILFWEPECSHCKEITPKLFKEYQELKTLGAEVIAFNTRIDKEPWIKFISEHKLTWVNAYSPSQYRANTERYQAWSTPRIFILDHKRRIIAKDISHDQIIPFLKQEIQREGN